VSGQLAGEGRSGAGELERARAVDDLLRRAYHGPPGDPAADAAGTAGARRLSARDRRVAARTRATTAPRRADSVQSADATVGHAMPAGTGTAGAAAGQHDDGPVAKVIPLGIFDPFEEAKKRR
jgi:putative transposase